MYFDWWINQPAFAPYLQRMAAYYYDESASRKQGPVLTFKQEAFPPNAAMLDIERGKLDALRPQPWQSDTSASIKSWGYVKDDHYRTAGSLLTDLIDVVREQTATGLEMHLPAAHDDLPYALKIDTHH